jgi:glutamine phosphoribosylpyrophosphate amidotransferase
MCAIIGAYIENPSSLDLVMLADVFRESSIRGLHATGVSWVRDGEVKTRIDAKPATQFLESLDLNNCVNEDGNLYLIGHCRYSTSDLEFNQPLWNENISIVHNGVITQEMPENWERLYGYKCKTRNDSELIVHTLEAKKSPLVEFSNASMAVVELYKEKQLRFYRNGKRPIYFTSLTNGGIITSTKDIALRSDLKDPIEIDMNCYVTIAKNIFRKNYVIIDDAKDLQHVR